MMMKTMSWWLLIATSQSTRLWLVGSLLLPESSTIGSKRSSHRPSGDVMRKDTPHYLCQLRVPRGRLIEIPSTLPRIFFAQVVREGIRRAHAGDSNFWGTSRRIIWPTRTNERTKKEGVPVRPNERKGESKELQSI
jgi:hypothetical protein